MAARLQQLTTVLILLLAIGVAIALWRAGRPAVAVLAATALLGLHAWFLALEFVVMAWINRRDPAPRASPVELAVAWWGEVAAATRVFAWWQPFRTAAEEDHLPSDAMNRRGVVLVHGFLCNRALWTRWMRRLRSNGTVFTAVTMEPVFGGIDAYVPIIEQAVKRVTALTGHTPVIVAHSMGGLAVRRWLADARRQHQAHHVITLGTPHHGTWLAGLALSANARQMRIGSHWQQALRTPAGDAPPYTCFYSHCDNIVFPASTACLPGARNEHLRAVAHVAMIDHPAPFNALRQLLR